VVWGWGGVAAGWASEISILRNELVLFNQCSVFILPGAPVPLASTRRGRGSAPIVRWGFMVPRPSVSSPVHPIPPNSGYATGGNGGVSSAVFVKSDLIPSVFTVVA